MIVKYDSIYLVSIQKYTFIVFKNKMKISRSLNNQPPYATPG